MSFSPSTVSAFTLGPSFLTPAQKAALKETAEKVATPGKGITACDEGPATIGARFEAVGVENSEETRRVYRQMLFTAPGCENYLSAAILDPETLYQVNNNDSFLCYIIECIVCISIYSIPILIFLNN